VHGIAEELGVDVQTVRRWIQSGKLRAFKPGKEYRVREADLEEFLAAREVRPKAESGSPPEPSRFNDADLEHEWALRYLGAWREFVWKLQEEWKEEPPRTSRDIAPLLNAMTALVKQGVFELSNASSGNEHIELTLVMEGLKRLNAIADKVEADEEAEKRRAVLRVVEDQIGA